MKNPATKEQAETNQNDESFVYDLVIKDIGDRVNVGKKAYGTPLQPFNGRSALVDLYQELIDASFYIRQKIEEDDQLLTLIDDISILKDRGDLPGLYKAIDRLTILRSRLTV